MSAVEQTRTVLSALHKCTSALRKYIASVHPRKCQQGKIQADKDKQRQLTETNEYEYKYREVSLKIARSKVQKRAFKKYF